MTPKKVDDDVMSANSDVFFRSQVLDTWPKIFIFPLMTIFYLIKAKNRILKKCTIFA